MLEQFLKQPWFQSITRLFSGPKVRQLPSRYGTVQPDQPEAENVDPIKVHLAEEALREPFKQGGQVLDTAISQAKASSNIGEAAVLVALRNLRCE